MKGADFALIHMLLCYIACRVTPSPATAFLFLAASAGWSAVVTCYVVSFWRRLREERELQKMGEDWP